MKKLSTILTVLGISFALPTKAVCPVCVVAVGAGLGLSRYLRIDDTITGLWIGGLTFALIMWTINWAKPKIKNQKLIPVGNLVIFLSYYALIAWPLTSQNFIGHPLNTIWGIDKIILGIILGSVVFLAMSQFYLYLKKKNNGHAHFPFQKVLMPFSALTVLSLLFYLVTR